MKSILYLLAVAADIVSGYPNHLFNRQQGTGLNGGIPLNSANATQPITSSVSGNIITSSTSLTPVISSSSSVNSSSSSFSTPISSASSVPPISSTNGTASTAAGFTNTDPNNPAGTTSTFNTGSSPSTISSADSSTTGTITAPAILPTGTIASLSTQSTSVAGVTLNTEITTTDNQGHHTVVPFLWGCWFCGGGGLLLWGVPPLPGIYPPPIPPPFPSWPVITIGNDNIPTPDPSKNDDPSNTATQISASTTSSCTASTVTDYWVECPSATSGPSSSCSTYSSSTVTGCSVTQAISTSIAACTAPASVDSDDLLPGETYGPEYNFVDPTISASTPDWTYTVAVVESTGVVGGELPSASANSTMSVVPSSVTTLSSAISASNSSLSIITTPAPTGDPLCTPFEDPDNGVNSGYCQCSSGSFITTTPLLSSTDNQCGYTSLTIPPPPSTSAPPSTTSPSPSATPPPPQPAAECKFWDEGWGWTFEVDNIVGWSTDGGSSLHNNENGCGALTGWSYKTPSSGGQATFNLPFFIKDGCVERAIASAGGPKLSCQGEGWGKRSVAGEQLKSLIPAGGVSHAAALPDFDNASVAKAYNPPGVDIASVSHSYTPETWNTARKRSFAAPKRPVLSQTESKSLQKRGCIPSKQVQPAPNQPPPPPARVPTVCNPIIPGVDECNSQIAAYGNVGTKTSLFYTGWGANGAPSVGGSMARKYATQNLCGISTVSWTGLCDGDWKIDVQNAIIQPFKKQGMTSDELFALNEKADPFLKNLSQSFAEQSKGDVYVFIPQGALPNNQWNMDSAWGGWEYPALTINTDVQRILRVDLDVTDPNNPKGTPQVIFDRSKGDGKAYDPKGIRGPSLPDGLPADQVPANWNQQGSL